jgi:hypothetical protein
MNKSSLVVIPSSKLDVVRSTLSKVCVVRGLDCNQVTPVGIHHIARRLRPDPVRERWIQIPCVHTVLELLQYDLSHYISEV